MRLVFIFMLLFCVGKGVFSNSITISDSTGSISALNAYTFIATDVSRNWTIDSMLETNRFTEKLKTGNNIGFSSAGRWLSFELNNQSSGDVEYVLALNISVINEVEFYEVAYGKVVKSVKTGELLPMESRDIKHRRFAFSMHIPKGEKRQYYVYLFNDGDSMYLPLSLKRSYGFFERDIYDSILLGIYIGVFFFIILFNVIYILSLKEVYYVFYTLYFIFATLFYMNIEGVIHILLPSSYPKFSDLATVLFAGVLHFCFLSFNANFFKRSYKDVLLVSVIDKLLKTISIYVIVGSMLPQPIYLSSVYCVLILVPVVFSFNLLTTLFLYVKRIESADYFFYAYVIGGSGKTIYILRDFGVVPDNVWSEHAIQATMIVESFIFFYAIMQRIKNNRIKAHNQLVEKNILLKQKQDDLHAVNKELEKLSIVAQETDNSVAIYDNAGSIEWYNDGFHKIFAYANNLKDSGFTMMQIYPNPEIHELVQIAVSLKESVVFETLVPGRGDTKKWIYTTLTPILDGEKCISKLIAIDSDITELKRTQIALEEAKDKAEESNRLKTAFLSNVSHELRTPLNSIIGFSQLLILKKFEEEKRVSFLRLINDNGNHLLNLIRDIIDISKIESGHMHVQVTQININDLIRELYDQFYMQTKNSGKEFEILRTLSLPDNQAYFDTDAVKLRQILLNIIGNSIKFTHKGHIHFGYTCDSEEIHFFVEDTGIGLSEEEINIVFHRFRQADDSITRKYGGTGLGLSISKGLIELLDGRLDVLSEKNKGTRISFSFKTNLLSSLQEKSREILLGKSSIIAGKKILVVEDDETNFSFLEEVLNENDAVVYHAENAAMAQNIFEEVELDMVLLDIQLPDKNGYELASIMRKQNIAIPIIAQTAYAYEEAKQRCFDSGCTDYVSKPIDYQVLVSKLELHLGE